MFELELDTAEKTTAKVAPTEVTTFARSFSQQLGLLMGRGFKLVLRNPGSIVRMLFAIIFGFFVGTLFLNTPSDANGTQTRAGFAYTMLMLLFNTACNAPMDPQFRDRGTFYVHRQGRFYRTSTYYISSMICGWPVCFLESTIFAITTFWLVGMNGADGTGFLYF